MFETVGRSSAALPLDFVENQQSPGSDSNPQLSSSHALAKASSLLHKID
jgi:hypothetical protein